MAVSARCSRNAAACLLGSSVLLRQKADELRFGQTRSHLLPPRKKYECNSVGRILLPQPCGKHLILRGFAIVVLGEGHFYMRYSQTGVPKRPSKRFGRPSEFHVARHRSHQTRQMPPVNFVRLCGCHNVNEGDSDLELHDLRSSQRKTLLSRPARPHLPAVLRRAARGDARLPQRLLLSAAGAGSTRSRVPRIRFDPGRCFSRLKFRSSSLYEREHLLMGLTYALAKAAQRRPHSERSAI